MFHGSIHDCVWPCRMLIQIWGGWIAGSLVWRSHALWGWMVPISWRCQNGRSRVLPWVRSLRRVSGHLASHRSPFVRKKNKGKIIKCILSECKDAGDRLQTPLWNLNESNHDEFPHYKHAFARSESQSEAVKRNDIMLHITSHFQNMIFKRQMMEESIIANYHIG